MTVLKRWSNSFIDVIGILVAWLSTFIPGFLSQLHFGPIRYEGYVDIALIIVVAIITVYITKEAWWRRILDFALIVFLATLISIISGIIICSTQHCLT